MAGTKPQKGIVLEKLLRISSEINEAERRQRISLWLESNGISNWIEFPIKEGRADIHLQHRHCIIETKTRVVLNKGIHEKGTGSRGNETAYQQLCRYVESDRLQHSLDSRSLAWIGAITDGARWHVYQWPVFGEGDKPVEVFSCDRLNRDKADSLLEIFQRHKPGKPWIPDDIKMEFDPYKEELVRLYAKVSAIREVRTKRHLWLAQLRSGGNAPEDSDANELFVTHTLIILISRMASGRRAGDPELYEGFVGWVEEQGAGILRRLQDKVLHFNWSAAQGDVLRMLYEKTVNPSHRQLYGEFYTPDWLCEKIVADTVDERYLTDEAAKFLDDTGSINGILDPACGSGTFLYYAVKRIMESKRVRRVFRDDEKLRDFALQMVTGIDIHPVAVEMATANIRRLLNTKRQIKIYQGDSIMLPHEDMSLFSSIDDNSLTLFTPKKHMIKFPLKFLEKDRNIRRFVSAAASNDSNMPIDLARGLNRDEKSTLDAAYKTMLKVVKDEGNDVWAWYISNHAKPLLLSKRTNRAGRIVANPPWVIIRKMSWDERTRTHVKTLAKNLGLWSGGKNAPNFDVSALFVSRCMQKYLGDGGKAAWVLQASALKESRTWSAIRSRYSDGLQTWMLNSTAFMRPSCVLLMNQGKNTAYVFESNHTFNGHESWSAVRQHIRIRRVSNNFEWKKSEWYKGRYMMARSGATLIPSPLIRIKRITGRTARTLTFETRSTNDKRWKPVGSLNGQVPRTFVRDCIFSNSLIPFHVTSTTKCVLPIRDASWIPGRRQNRFWRAACDTYAGYRAGGSPESLEGNLDSTGKLLYQLRNNRNMVIYNKAGERLYAAFNSKRDLVDRTIQYVLCRSEKEAWFLCAVLNADCLQDAYRATKQNPLDFVRFFWEKIPIPRYDPKNGAHVRLAKLAKEASVLMKEREWCDIGNHQARSRAVELVQKHGLAGRIDDNVRLLLPEYAR